MIETIKKLPRKGKEILQRVAACKENGLNQKQTKQVKPIPEKDKHS